MANQRFSGERSVYALVDSAPDTEGFWTDTVAKIFEADTKTIEK